jgi:hypothetical protein
MKRLSKKKLFETLTSLSTIEALSHFANINEKKQRLMHRSVSNETYGKDSHIYLGFANEEDKQVAVRALTKAGFDVNNGWTRGNKRAIDVPVTYFKGWHWDE